MSEWLLSSLSHFPVLKSDATTSSLFVLSPFLCFSFFRFLSICCSSCSSTVVGGGTDFFGAQHSAVILRCLLSLPSLSPSLLRRKASFLLFLLSLSLLFSCLLSFFHVQSVDFCGAPLLVNIFSRCCDCRITLTRANLIAVPDQLRGGNDSNMEL